MPETNKRTVFTPLTIESAVEHLKQGHTDNLYFLNKGSGFVKKLSHTQIDFTECLNVEWFFRSYMD